MNTAAEIYYSKAKVEIDFKGSTLCDALNFGFSYIESEDHVVEYVVANSKNIKRIFAEVADSTVNPEADSIGELWTAKILLSRKLNSKQILFSNSSFSVVINLNINPYEEERSHGNV